MVHDAVERVPRFRTTTMLVSGEGPVDEGWGFNNQRGYATEMGPVLSWSHWYQELLVLLVLLVLVGSLVQWEQAGDRERQCTSSCLLLCPCSLI